MSISLHKRTLQTGLICIKGKLFFLFFCFLFSSSVSQLQSAWTKFSPRMMAKTMDKLFPGKTAEMKYSKQFPQCTAKGTELM